MWSVSSPQGHRGSGRRQEQKERTSEFWGNLGHVTSCPSLEMTANPGWKKSRESLLSSSSLIPGPRRPKLAQTRWLLALDTAHEATQRSSICLKESDVWADPYIDLHKTACFNTKEKRSLSVQTVSLFLTLVAFSF